MHIFKYPVFLPLNCPTNARTTKALTSEKMLKHDSAGFTMHKVLKRLKGQLLVNF